MLTIRADWIIPDWPDQPKNVKAFTTTRGEGFSRVPYDDGKGGLGLNLGDHVGDTANSVSENRKQLGRYLPTPVTFLSQTHGIIAVDVADLRVGCEADAVYSTEVNQVCAILTADCLPVLFASLDGQFVGAAHAGWRGLAHGVLENTAAQLRAKGAEKLTAWLGPAIGPKKFEVGEEVLDTFTERFGDVSECFRAASKPKKYFADIYALARIALHKSGVKHVSGGGFCTVSEPRRFYSFRRDQQTGRMATLIWFE